MEKKYILTRNDIIKYNGHILYRIQAVKSFDKVKKGDLGGYVESEDNLSHEGNAWVKDDAWVFGDAFVADNSLVYGNAVIGGSARIGHSAKIYGEAFIAGDAIIETNTDYIVFKNWWSSGRYFTWTRSNNMWSVGCFYGTGEELIKKACADSEESRREYARVVKYVKEISKFM